MKRYLNSVEEVIKALKEGKDVGDIKTHDVYKMVDNVIYGYYNNGDIVVNDSVVFQKDRIYTEEPEPLKFEVNRAYRNRAGTKMFLDKIGKEGRLYFICVDDNYWTDKNGKYRKGESNGNIVGYWEE